MVIVVSCSPSPHISKDYEEILSFIVLLDTGEESNNWLYGVCGDYFYTKSPFKGTIYVFLHSSGVVCLDAKCLPLSEEQEIRMAEHYKKIRRKQ